MKKEKFVRQLPILRCIGVIQLLLIIMVFSSLFVLIWTGWSLAWRLGLTGIVGILVCYIAYKAIESVAIQKFDEVLNESPDEKLSGKPKSKWQHRLDEMQEQRKNQDKK